MTIFDTIHGLNFSVIDIQYIYIQDLPLYIVVFICSGGVRHSRAVFRLPS